MLVYGARWLLNMRDVRRMLLCSMIIVVACFVGLGKARAGENETETDTLAVEHTVLRYSQLLAEGYSKMNMTPLQAVATEEQASRVYRHMAALGDAGTRMESELKDIEFLDIQISDKDGARVKTRERWNYIHQSTDTGLARRTVVEGLIYELAYNLVRQDSRWLVSSISVLSEERAGEPATTDNAGFKGPEFKSEGANPV